jgi:sulfate permease, SulP family
MNDPSVDHRSSTWLPGLRLFLSYDRANLSSDLIAGIVVTLVLIPSAIAYSDLAKCPPAAGLYAALGGMVAFALFTSSRQVVTGPDAAVAILVGGAVGPLASADPGQAIVLSTWLAILVAAILLVAAWLKLGAIAELLSSPVMLGFMNGAAVVIIASQLGKLCGFTLHEENTLQKLIEWLTGLQKTHLLSLAIGAAAIALLAGLRLWVPAIPGTIIVFAAALFAGRLIDFENFHMAVIGVVDTKLPSPVPPELSLTELGRLLTAALGLALLIFPEGILLGRAMAIRHNYELHPDRELVALGMANLAAGLLRSFAVGASQSRTLLNSATGGKTQMVSLIAAALLVAFMYFLASWIATIPTVAIAAILIFTGITLIDFRGWQQLRRQHAFSARVALCTSIGVIVFGVLPGILVGIVLSLLKVLVQIVRPHDALLGRAPGTDDMHDLGDDESAQTIPGLVVYRFYGPLLFANVQFFVDRLEYFIGRERQAVRHVILDARAITDIDVTAVEQLHSYFKRLRQRGITLAFAKAQLPLRQAAKHLGFDDVIAEGTYFQKLSAAVLAFENSANTRSASVDLSGPQTMTDRV